MKKIVIATDSFKGSLSSAEVEEAIADGFRKVFPDIAITQIALGDGGEGTLDALVSNRIFEKKRCAVHDPLMRRIEAVYGIDTQHRRAYIEMAEASGLTLLEEPLRNPLLTTSYGTGELIENAIGNGCTEIIIGLGGSATSDGGAGLLQALGFSLTDAEGNRIPDGTGGGALCRIHTITATPERVKQLEKIKFTVACDVRSPFTGPDGATYVFAPQKGAAPSDLPLLEKGMVHLSELIFRHCGKDIRQLPGAGAAGGTGGCLMAFFDAHFVSGIEYMLEATRFEKKTEGADLIITGEGKADRQTLMGKLPQGVLHKGLRHQIPTLLIAGSVDDRDELTREGFKAILPVLPSPCTLQEAMRPETVRKNISSAAESAARLLSM